MWQPQPPHPTLHTISVPGKQVLGVVVPALPLWERWRTAGRVAAPSSLPACPSWRSRKPFDLENMANTGTPVWKVAGSSLSLSLHLMLWWCWRGAQVTPLPLPQVGPGSRGSSFHSSSAFKQLKEAHPVSPPTFLLHCLQPTLPGE